MILVSACLAGINCKYDGGHNLNEQILDDIDLEDAFPVCPEELGNFDIPRPKMEIVGGTGADVLDGRCRVITIEGKDVTDDLIKAANATLECARLMGVTKAILKSNSPSCGCEYIYDGTFSGKLVKGRGVTAELLAREGIELISADRDK